MGYCRPGAWNFHLCLWKRAVPLRADVCRVRHRLFAGDVAGRASWEDALQIVVAIVVGGILAAVLYSLVKFALHIAGGLLGLVLMLVILGLFKLGGIDLGLFGWILAPVGLAGAGGFFGNRIGDIVIVIATGVGTRPISSCMGTGGAVPRRRIPANPIALLGTAFPLIMYISIALISGLAQYQAYAVRRQFLR